MYSPEDQQIEICLLKSNLEEIENDLVVQHSALPALDAENEQQYKETMTALKVARSLNAEMERQKQENVRLTAKRTQLTRQFDDINRALDKAHEHRIELGTLIKQEEEIEESCIRQYEETLREKADRFRKTRGFYNEEEMVTEIEKVENSNVLLEGELDRSQNIVNGLKEELKELHPDVPEDILNIVGKLQLEETVTTLSGKCEDLQKTLNNLVSQRPVQSIKNKKM